jgi:EmrB/QacA subfamily drug resistance transporter
MPFLAPAASAATGKIDSPWAIFRLVAVAVFLVSLDATIVLSAFPALRSSFVDTTPAALSWVLNAYTIAYAALLVPSGRLADMYGRRRIFLVGLAIFGAASGLAGLAPNLAGLVGLRVLQAAGAALLTPASLALILAAFPAEKRAVAVSLWAALGALAAAFGPALGGVLVQYAGWQSVFAVNVPIVAWAFWRCRTRLAETQAATVSRGRIDVFGIGLLVGGVSLLVLGIVQFDDWRPSAAAGASGAGLALVAGFVFWARGCEGSALDLALFSEPSYAWANAATLVFGAVFSMMFLGFFLFLGGIWHFAPAVVGLMITPGPLIVIPVAILAGKIAARIGHRPILIAGGFVYACANLWLALRIDIVPDYLAIWLPGQVMGGIGVGLVLPALSGAAVARLAPTRFGVGNAANAAIRQIGGAIGAAAAVLMVGSVDASLADFRTFYGVLAFGSVATALLCLPVDTRPRG